LQNDAHHDVEKTIGKDFVPNGSPALKQHGTVVLRAIRDGVAVVSIAVSAAATRRSSRFERTGRDRHDVRSITELKRMVKVFCAQ
jgi:hypothetical protein